ncbi:MAG: hypothetical protein GY730_08135, partial [bacterium]|nr:hypothetical protein [bacterium]
MSNRPMVSIDLVTSDNNCYDLLIQNVGKTIAYDLTFKFKHDFEFICNLKDNESGITMISELDIFKTPFNVGPNIKTYCSIVYSTVPKIKPFTIKVTYIDFKSS